MTPEELCKELGGEISLNRMKAVVDGKLQVIARMDSNGEYQFEPVGAAKAAEYNAGRAVGLSAPDAPPAAEEDKPKRKARKKVDDFLDDAALGLSDD